MVPVQNVTMFHCGKGASRTAVALTAARSAGNCIVVAVNGAKADAQCKTKAKSVIKQGVATRTVKASRQLLVCQHTSDRTHNATSHRRSRTPPSSPAPQLHLLANATLSLPPSAAARRHVTYPKLQQVPEKKAGQSAATAAAQTGMAEAAAAAGGKDLNARTREEKA